MSQIDIIRTLPESQMLSLKNIPPGTVLRIIEVVLSKEEKNILEAKPIDEKKNP